MFIMLPALSQPLKGLSITYLILYSGKKFNCTSIQYESPNIITDIGLFKADSVKFYNNLTGSYANVRHLSKRNTSTFMRAVKSGPINLYSQTITVVNNGGWKQDNRTGAFKYEQDQSMTNEYLYYNKGTGSLKKAKYKNLKTDMSDNPASMKYVRKCRNIRIAEISIYTLSLAMATVGIAAIFDENESNENLTYAGPPVGILLYYLLRGNNLKQKRIKKAVEAYNK